MCNVYVEAVPKIQPKPYLKYIICLPNIFFLKEEKTVILDHCYWLEIYFKSLIGLSYTYPLP